MADNKNRDTILACLTEAGEPLSLRNLTATTGLAASDAKTALETLQSAGLVEASGSGRSQRWALATGPKLDGATEPADESSGPTGPDAAQTPAAETSDEPETTEAVQDAEESDAPTEEDEEDEDPGTPLAPEKLIDPEVVFTATMLDHLGLGAAFTAESFAATCGKATTAERNRLLRALWALAEHGLVAKSDPNNVEGGTWSVESSAIAASAVEHRIQVTDAPETIEVRIVKRMPWANGGTKGNRSVGDHVRGDTKPARVRRELRKQIDAVLSEVESGTVVTPGWVAEAVRKIDPHHRDADPNAVNNYLKELQLSGKLADATAETGQRSYRLA